MPVIITIACDHTSKFDVVRKNISRMEFSQDESEEVIKLKKQLIEERLHLSQLRQTQSKITEENKNFKEKIKQCQSSLDESVARLDRSERDRELIQSERDRFRVSNANLDQALSQAKAQLLQKSKLDRLNDDAREDAMSRRENEMIKEMKEWQEKCKALEIRLKDVQSMTNAGSSSVSSDAKSILAKLLSLENENTALKADNQKLRQSSTLNNHSNLDSNTSNINAMGSEEQQLRELNGELNQQIEAAKERALRAEREVLIASNERLANEKRTKSAIESLEASRDDLKDEVKVREVHINELEKQLQGIHVLLENESGSPINDSEEKIRKLIQDGKDVLSIRTILMKWRAGNVNVANTADLPKSANDLALQIVKAYSELDTAYQTTKRVSETNLLHVQDLQKELQQSSHASKALKMREKEMVKAKGRLKMLSGSLQKALPLAAGLQSVMGDASMSGAGGVSFSSIGDETATGGNESTIGGFRGFEADLVDEMEQLITYVEDLDNRLEFQRVEQEIREMSAIGERDRLRNELSILERELLEVRASMQNATESHQNEVNQLQEKMRMEVEKAEVSCAIAQQQENACIQMEKKLAHHELLANQDVDNLLQLLDKFYQALQDEGLRWQTMSKLQSVDMTQFAANLIKRSAECDTLQRAEIGSEREKVCQLEAALSDQREQNQAEKQRLDTENQNLIDSMREEMEYWRAQIEKKAKKEEEQGKIIEENDLLIIDLREENTKERSKAEVLRKELIALESELLEANAIKDEKLEEAQREIDAFRMRDTGTHNIARERELIEALTVAQSTIEHLEHELTIKAQECEDADDKEIALRKDNKRLLSRIATMQTRLEKLQEQLQQSKALDTLHSNLPTSNSSTSLTPSHSTGLSKDQPMTRKRRNSDMEKNHVNEEKIMVRDAEKVSSSKVDRAYIYAPGPTSMTIDSSQQNAFDRSSTAFKIEQHDNHSMRKTSSGTPSDKTGLKQKVSSSDEIAINAPGSEGQMSLNRSQGRSGGSSKPSDLVAMRLQQKIANEANTVHPHTANVNPVRIKDRTNKPRENVNGKPTVTSIHKDSNQTEKSLNDNNFMAKLNRYRTPSNGLSGTKTTAMQDYSRPPLRG